MTISNQNENRVHSALPRPYAFNATSRQTSVSSEEWTEDIKAVLDAAGFASAAVFAELDAGILVAMLFAAMHPERASALVPTNATEDLMRMSGPCLAQDAYLRSSVRTLRAAATPSTAEAPYRSVLESLRVRSALPLIQILTLALHNEGDRLVPAKHDRYIARAHSRRQTCRQCRQVTSPSKVPASSMSSSEVLTGQRSTITVERVLTTVLFTDIVSSTEQLASMGDRRWRVVLDAHDRVVRNELRRFGGKEIRTTGDGFVVSFDGPARAIRCAQAIIENTRNLDIELRTGLHTGECDVRGDDLGGLAIHLAARVGSMAASGEVLVSRTVVDLVAGSGIEFEDRGEHELKGVPGTWQLYAATA